MQPWPGIGARAERAVLALVWLVWLGGCGRGALDTGVSVAGDVPPSDVPPAEPAPASGGSPTPPRAGSPSTDAGRGSRPVGSARDAGAGSRPDAAEPPPPDCPDVLVAPGDDDPGCREPHVWSRALGNSQDYRPSVVGFDDDRALFVAFRYMYWADLGDGRRTPMAGEHFSRVLAKYGATGELLWSRELYGMSVEDMTVDAGGDVRLVGYLFGEQRIGDAVLDKPDPDAGAVFVLELSGTDGTPTWWQTATVTYSSISLMRVLAMATGETWFVSDELETHFGATPGSVDGALHRFDASGELLGVTRVEGVREVADAFVDGEGRAWLVVALLDDASPRTAVRLDVGGEQELAVPLPNESWLPVHAALMPDGALAFAARGGGDAYELHVGVQIVDGELSWERTLALEGSSRLAGLAVDRFGRIVVSLESTAPVELDGVTLPGRFVLLRFAPDGTPLWSRAFGPDEGVPRLNGSADDLAVHPDGDVFMAGTYLEGPLDFSRDPDLALPVRPDDYTQFVARLRFSPP